MVLDAEKVRFAAEYVTRVANDFSSTNMFVKNCSLLLRGGLGIHSLSTWRERMALPPDSVVSFETEELVHCRGRDPVSAYPLIRLACNIDILWSTTEKVVGRIVPETLPEPLKIFEVLLKSLASLVMLILLFDHSLGSDLCRVHIVMQVEIYDLTSSERVKRGVKRAWLIGETLALETGSGQKQPNIHRTKYKGVRFRPSRSRTKPWTAEVKPPMEKNKVWIDDCNTPEAAAHAYDVAAFYYGKGNKALNFEHTPRFLPKTLEYSCEKDKKHAIQEQARHLRRNQLFYFIHQLPYVHLFCFVIWELCQLQGRHLMGLALLVVQLMRLVRKDSTVIAFLKWVSLNKEIAYLHAPTNIPQLLERIDCLIEEIQQQKQGHYYRSQSLFKVLLQWRQFHRTPWDAQHPLKNIPLTFQFIEWVRINLVTPQTTSMEVKHLPASPSQCNGPYIMLLEIDLRAPKRSSMVMQAEGPLVNIPPQCNALSMQYRHEQIQQIQVTGAHKLIISHTFSGEIRHRTYQDATPEEQVVQSPIAGQAATIVLSTPVAAIGETSLLPSPPLCVGILNEGYQTGDLYEDIQEGSMSGERRSTSGTLSNFHCLPFSCFSPLSTGAQTQSSTFMDSELEHFAFQVTSPEEDECIKCPTDQAATEILDLDDGEDLATLLDRLQHDQLGDIGDWVACDEATLREGCNPDINDMVLTSVPGDIEGNEISSLCEYEHVMEPPHPFAFSQQPFVQFDEYL